MKRSSTNSPSFHDEDDELAKSTKRSCPISYNYPPPPPPRYHYKYEYELSNDDNSIVDPPPSSTVLDLVSTVRINFRVNYILRKRKSSIGDDVDETLDSIQRCFYMRLYLITGLADYSHRLFSLRSEFCQLRGDMLYEVNKPEEFLTRFLRDLGVFDYDVIQKLIGDTKDFVNRKRARESRVLPIAITLKVYTLQQEDETIDAAKRRAATTTDYLVRVDCADQLIKLLERPPPYKFMIEFDDDHEMLRGDCCICLSKLSVGEEVLFLSCSHAYHYDCVTNWVDNKGNQCPLCRCPMNLTGFIQAFHFQSEKVITELKNLNARWMETRAGQNSKRELHF